MLYREVLSIDYNFSELTLGCQSFSGEKYWMGFSEKNAEETIEMAIDEGINIFDVSPLYGFGFAETFVGDVLKKVNKRNKVFLSTKCGLVWDSNKKIRNDLSKETIYKEVDQSLKRLKTDYIDIYYCNWPDPNTDIEETMETLVDLKKEGKIRYIGFSNFSAEQTRQALRVGKVNAIQNLYNIVERNPKSHIGFPLNRDIEEMIFPLCYEEGMAFFPYSPLMQGILGGDFRNKKIIETDMRFENSKLHGEKLDNYLEIADTLNNLAKEFGKTLNQIAINFLLRRERVTSVIVGVSKKEQLKSNIQALDFVLTEEQLELIDRSIREFYFVHGLEF